MLRVDNGFYGVGHTPFGYRRVDESTSLEIVHREARVVKRIFRMYAKTQSVGQVADYLNARGDRTRRKNKWSRQAIHIILASGTYRGRTRQGCVARKDCHEAIIDAALFEQAQKIRKSKMRPKQ